ncbi:hypothetical protein A176_006644 [Myxococcus hansupus]|uniref:Lipoprotein n=1 Tax=Pseudomyxococcus hansupus TaxID=1297742 RepID=A0A0H4XMZ0_9BACT|nr:hypothetical protein [Myxococcus hansupus]AKQ69732.1 hypothetical protein A176_006644 [Myxococcus hansupus]
MTCIKGWIRLALVSVVLSAPTTLAAGRTQCDADCSTEGGSELSACMSKCPNAGRNQTCASRCAKTFKEKVAACTKRCPKGAQPVAPVEIPMDSGDDEGKVIEVAPE